MLSDAMFAMFLFAVAIAAAVVSRWLGMRETRNAYELGRYSGLVEGKEVGYNAGWIDGQATMHSDLVYGRMEAPRRMEQKACGHWDYIDEEGPLCMNCEECERQHAANIAEYEAELLANRAASTMTPCERCHNPVNQLNSEGLCMCCMEAENMPPLSYWLSEQARIDAEMADAALGRHGPVPSDCTDDELSAAIDGSWTPTVYQDNPWVATVRMEDF
jgi:ferredoxin